MLNEKKTAVTEEVKEEVRKLTDEDLEQVNGGLKLDPERLRRKVEEVYPTE